MESELMKKDVPVSTAFCHEADFNCLNVAILENIKKSVGGKFSDQLDPVVELVRNIPPFSGNMLEFHFNRSHAPFDFAFRINKDFDAPLLNLPLLPENATPFIHDGCRQVFQKSMPDFRYGIENICFEYDSPFQAAPALFFDLHRDKEFLPATTFEDLRRVASLFQHPISDELLDFFVKVKKNRLHVVYSGFMHSRKEQSIRFTIEAVKRNNLLETVATLGWKGDYNRLHNLQQTYLNSDQRLVLCIDFDKCLGHKLGIEVHDPDWSLLLEKLTTNGICNEKQYALLSSWSGKTALSNSPSVALTTLHQRPVTCLYRRLNHFKFTFDKDAVNTKAYLYYCF